jgi:hypothetical protein
MSEVKRYRCDWDGKQLFQEVHNTGEYVLYSDYEKLKAQLEKAEDVIDFYSDSDNWIVPDSAVPYWTLWSDGDNVAFQKANKALKSWQEFLNGK